MPLETSSADGTSWTDAFAAPLSRIPRGSAAWSIAELKISDQEFSALVNAFSKLSGFDWEILQESSGEKRDRSRLFLIAVLSEHARRHTRGDQIWGCMGNLPMRDSLRTRLFHANGQPTRELRTAIESAAYRWNLRHVFSVPGHMAWFVTLFLQFGFPLPAAKKRLPFWLSGQIVPVAAGYLLGGSMQSPSFFLAWQAMKAYRRGLTTEGKCREALERSPWILDGWIPELLTWARSRLDLADYGDTEEDDETEPVILGDPRFIWTSEGEPCFRCEILAAATFDLEAPCYEVRGAGFEAARILRQEDGSYYLSGISEVTATPTRASLQCLLTAIGAGTGEEEIATQSLSLWDPLFPISLYRKNGGTRMPDPEHPANLEQGCFAIFHESFAISPQPLRALTNGSRRFVELPPCRPGELALLQDGERVWWPAEDEGRVASRTPLLVTIQAAHSAPIEWTKPDRPPQVRFEIELPPRSSLRWVRLGHEIVETAPNGNWSHRTAPFELNPAHAVYPFYVTVGFQMNGRSHRVTKRVDLNLSACFLETEGALSIYDSRRALNTRNARRFLFHILRPTPPETEEANRRRDWIIEGSHVVKTVSDRAFPLTNLVGYGEPLQLFHGLYNTESAPKLLISRVRDNGAVKTIKFNAEELRLVTSSPMELDAGHEIIAWTVDHRFLRFSGDQLLLDEEKNEWACPLAQWQDEEGRNPIFKAVVFTYQGERLGNWFDRQFHFAITQITTGEQAARCAEMLRWFKAPVLDDEVRGAMRFLLQRFPGDVVPIWLSASRSPELDLAELPVDDGWLRVVSILLGSTRLGDLSLADASQIVEAVSPEFNPSDLANSLPKALEALDGLSANLIAKIAHLYLTEMRQGRLPGNANATKDAILARFAVSGEDQRILCEGRDERDKGLGIDPFFAKSVLDRAANTPQQLTEMDEHNRDLLLNHRLFRRLLTHLFLSRL